MESHVSFGKSKLWKYGEFYLRFLQEESEAHFYRDLQLGENDIIVSGFPKSGTTWVAEIVYLLQNGIDAEEAKLRTIDNRVPLLEHTHLSIDAIMAAPEPRILKCVLPYCMQPQVLRHNKGKIVYIARNPMDVVVSSYFFNRMQSDTSFSGNFEDYFKLFLNGTVNCGPWWKHVTEFWEHRDDDNLLFITYEDLHENPARIIREIAQFFGKPLNEADTEKLCKLTSFTNMEKNDSVNHSWWNKNGKRNVGETEFLRKGKVGDWKNYFSNAMVEQMDIILGEHVTPKGLEFRME